MTQNPYKIEESIGYLTGSFNRLLLSRNIRVSASEIQPAPSVASGGIGQEYIEGVINHADRLLVLLNLDMMFSNEEKELFGSI
jgi:purine-binding chemotaxis protein CheW